MQSNRRSHTVKGTTIADDQEGSIRVLRHLIRITSSKETATKGKDELLSYFSELARRFLVYQVQLCTRSLVRFIKLEPS
jgi:hypothetical protein